LCLVLACRRVWCKISSTTSAISHCARIVWRTCVLRILSRRYNWRVLANVACVVTNNCNTAILSSVVCRILLIC
jgi:hypothetical protein